MNKKNTDIEKRKKHTNESEMKAYMLTLIKNSIERTKQKQQFRIIPIPPPKNHGYFVEDEMCNQISNKMEQFLSEFLYWQKLNRSLVHNTNNIDLVRDLGTQKREMSIFFGKDVKLLSIFALKSLQKFYEYGKEKYREHQQLLSRLKTMLTDLQEVSELLSLVFTHDFHEQLKYLTLLEQKRWSIFGDLYAVAHSFDNMYAQYNLEALRNPFFLAVNCIHLVERMSTVLVRILLIEILWLYTMFFNEYAQKINLHKHHTFLKKFGINSLTFNTNNGRGAFVWRDLIRNMSSILPTTTEKKLEQQLTVLRPNILKPIFLDKNPSINKKTFDTFFDYKQQKNPKSTDHENFLNIPMSPIPEGRFFFTQMLPLICIDFTLQLSPWFRLEYSSKTNFSKKPSVLSYPDFDKSIDFPGNFDPTFLQLIHLGKE